jgi:hypothetical protein
LILSVFYKTWRKLQRIKTLDFFWGVLKAEPNKWADLPIEVLILYPDRLKKTFREASYNVDIANSAYATLDADQLQKLHKTPQRPTSTNYEIATQVMWSAHKQFLDGYTHDSLTSCERRLLVINLLGLTFSSESMYKATEVFKRYLLIDVTDILKGLPRSPELAAAATADK